MLNTWSITIMNSRCPAMLKQYQPFPQLPIQICIPQIALPLVTLMVWTKSCQYCNNQLIFMQAKYAQPSRHCVVKGAVMLPFSSGIVCCIMQLCIVSFAPSSAGLCQTLHNSQSNYSTNSYTIPWFQASYQASLKFQNVYGSKFEKRSVKLTYL